MSNRPNEQETKSSIFWSYVYPYIEIFLKSKILIFIILIVSSCQDKTDCYDCFLNQFPIDQQIFINDLNSEFESFLNYNFPDLSTKQERLRQYCQSISEVDYEERIDSTEIRKLLFDYKKSGLEQEFRDLSSNKTSLNGLHFQAQRNCMEYDYNDSLMYNYIWTYEKQGDLSAGRLAEYIANEADKKSLDRRILEHFFIMEYFIPRMMNKHIERE